MPTARLSHEGADRLRQEGQILLGGQAPDVAGDEGLLRDAVGAAKRRAVAVRELLHLDARGDHLDRGLHAPLVQQRRDALARRDDAVAQVAVAGHQRDDKLAQPARPRRDVVDVVLIHRVVREDQRTADPAGDPNGGIAQQVRMVRVDKVRPTFLQAGPQNPRHGQGKREIAAVEVLEGRDANHVHLAPRLILEPGRDDDDAMARRAAPAGERQDRPRHASHERRVRIRDHPDIHNHKKDAWLFATHLSVKKCRASCLPLPGRGQGTDCPPGTRNLLLPYAGRSSQAHRESADF